MPITTDTGYFICLGVTLLCGIGAPVFAWKSFHEKHGRNAVLLGLCTSLGFVCSLPFLRTREFPWFPFAALVYFGTTLIATVVHGIHAGRRPPEDTGDAETRGRADAGKT